MGSFRVLRISALLMVRRPCLCRAWEERAAEVVDSSSLRFLTASALESRRKEEEEQERRRQLKAEAKHETRMRELDRR